MFSRAARFNYPKPEEDTHEKCDRCHNHDYSFSRRSLRCPPTSKSSPANTTPVRRAPVPGSLNKTGRKLTSIPVASPKTPGAKSPQIIQRDLAQITETLCGIRRQMRGQCNKVQELPESTRTLSSCSSGFESSGWSAVAAAGPSQLFSSSSSSSSSSAEDDQEVKIVKYAKITEVEETITEATADFDVLLNVCREVIKVLYAEYDLHQPQEVHIAVQTICEKTDDEKICPNISSELVQKVHKGKCFPRRSVKSVFRRFMNPFKKLHRLNKMCDLL